MANLDLIYRLLLDANETALRRGDEYGLCDAIDNAGNPYPSQAIADVISEAAEYVARVDNIPSVGVLTMRAVGQMVQACPSCALGLCPDNKGGFIPCTICGRQA